MIQMRNIALGSILTLFSFYSHGDELSSKEVECVAKTVNGEAAPTFNAQKGVIDTLINRLKSPRVWGDSFCAIVYKRNQFYWTRHPQKYSGKKWELSVSTTKQVLDSYVNGTWEDSTYGATHFNNRPFKRHKVLVKYDGLYFSKP